MARKKPTKKKKQPRRASQPRSFTGMLRGRDRTVRDAASALRELVLQQLPQVQETFHSGQNPLAMYRTDAEVCRIQPFSRHCNFYLTRGPELADPNRLLQGTSDRARYVRIRETEEIDQYPLREWIRESVALNGATIEVGVSFDEALQSLREIALALPNTKETLTWGNPHFRVGEKIFCGCGEAKGKVSLGLKAQPDESRLLMKLPGIVKAAYSRPNDGWISIDPALFDDWDEIGRLVLGSYRLIAPKRLLAQHGL